MELQYIQCSLCLYVPKIKHLKPSSISGKNLNQTITKTAYLNKYCTKINSLEDKVCGGKLQNFVF